MKMQKILQEIQKYEYFAQHDKVLVAVSGGVDSMNLLLFLQAHQEDLAIQIGLAHVNHKQRQESEIEEAYLRKWAQDHQVPFYLAHFSGNFSEKTAREFRYDFFKRVMEEEGYTALVTAHHADDQAETIFMRLLRGSRLRHLVGMQPVKSFGPGQLIRPFLKIEKKDLPDIFHFEDESNQSDTYLRNRIRHHYLPSLSQENPKFSAALRELGKETDHLLMALSDLTADIEENNLQSFRKQSPAVQYYLLQNYLEDFPDLSLTRAQFESLLKKIGQASPEDSYLKAGYYLHLQKDQFYLDKIGPRTDSVFPAQVLKYGNIVSFGQTSFEFGQTGEIAMTSLEPVTLRPRQAGDSIDFGSFHKKIRRLFIDEKIPTQERSQAIVAEQNDQIIFVLVGGHLYLRKESQCVTIKAKLCIKTRKNGDL